MYALCPKCSFLVQHFFPFFRRYEPVRRWILSAVFGGWNEIFRCPVNRKVKRRFRAERFDPARHITVRIFDHKIDMCLLVYVVEKRKRSRENKNPNRGHRAKPEN